MTYTDHIFKLNSKIDSKFLTSFESAFYSIAVDNKLTILVQKSRKSIKAKYIIKKNESEYFSMNFKITNEANFNEINQFFVYINVLGCSQKVSINDSYDLTRVLKYCSKIIHNKTILFEMNKLKRTSKFNRFQLVFSSNLTTPLQFKITN